MAKPKKKAASSKESPTPQIILVELVDKALSVAKTARKNNKTLSGVNFYATKMADLRADATNAFARLSTRSVGDTSALAELLQKVFSTDASSKDRVQAARDLQFAMKTTLAEVSVESSHLEEAGVFPLVTLNETKRGYLVSIGRQGNGCYVSGWFDSCAVMMRRLLESVIIEAFEARGIDQKIKDSTSGDFLQLTALINAALAETSWNLPRNVRRELPNLRDLGHRSAHNRYYLAKKPDIDQVLGGYRETIEAFLHLAKLL